MTSLLSLLRWQKKLEKMRGKVDCILDRELYTINREGYSYLEDN
jgi:hypothetical protein